MQGERFLNNLPVNPLIARTIKALFHRTTEGYYAQTYPLTLFVFNARMDSEQSRRTRLDDDDVDDNNQTPTIELAYSTCTDIYYRGHLPKVVYYRNETVAAAIPAPEDWTEWASQLL